MSSIIVAAQAVVIAVLLLYIVSRPNKICPSDFGAEYILCEERYAKLLAEAQTQPKPAPCDGATDGRLEDFREHAADIHGCSYHPK